MTFSSAKKKLKITTYTKTISLFLFFIIGFIVLFSTLFYLNSKHKETYYKTSSESLKREIDALVDLNHEAYTGIITEITYWDELVDFTKNKDAKWLDNSLAYLVDSYKVDYLDVYNIEETFINKLSTQLMRSKDFIPKNVFTKLYKDKFIHFYVKTSEGIMVMYGATIHASQDPFKNKTKPQGYLFLGKLLDEKYFAKIENISEAKGSYLKPNEEMAPYSISYIKPIKDINNKEIGTLVFKSASKLDFSTSRATLFTAISGVLLSILLLFYFARKWIKKPIELIQDIFESKNSQAINKLKNIGGEYRHIGKLFEQNRQQKLLLEKTKLQAEESDRLKTAFLMNLSHEIRTPMNAILGFSDLSLEKNSSIEEKDDYLKIIRKSGKNLIGIIDDLIEVSKIDSNNVKPNYTSINLNNILLATFESIKITMGKEKNIDFKFIPPKTQLTKKVITDIIKLNQILTHLLINAVKYTEEGFVIFEYHINNTTNMIDFYVKDSGIGIPDKDHEKIFLRFTKLNVNAEEDSTRHGLGLGLSIAKAYTEILGGTISVKSEIGVGSTFYFSIPLQLDESKDGTNMTPKPEDAIIDLGNEEIILVAEDDNLNYMLIDKLLKLFNFKILRAKNGEEAVKICKENDEIDLILMDIKMPYLDGHGAYKKIREFSDIPIIAQTAYSFPAEMRKIKETGFDGFIPKPIDKNLLLTIVKKHMGK